MPKIFFLIGYFERIILVIKLNKYNYELDFSRIKELRIYNNLSQKEVANYLNINQSTYSKFELNKATIPIEILNKLANYYKVSLDYLLKITDNPKIKIINMDIDKKKVGENLKQIRKDKKLYQETLAREIGTSHSLISEYEHGKKLVSLTYGYAICKKYNISLDYLYGKKNNSN